MTDVNIISKFRISLDIVQLEGIDKVLREGHNGSPTMLEATFNPSSDKVEARINYLGKVGNIVTGAQETLQQALYDASLSLQGQRAQGDFTPVPYIYPGSLDRSTINSALVMCKDAVFHARKDEKSLGMIRTSFDLIRRNGAECAYSPVVSVLAQTFSEGFYLLDQLEIDYEVVNAVHAGMDLNEVARKRFGLKGWLEAL